MAQANTAHTKDSNDPRTCSGGPADPADCLDRALELPRAKTGEHLDELTALSRDQLRDQANAAAARECRDDSSPVVG